MFDIIERIKALGSRVSAVAYKDGVVVADMSYSDAWDIRMGSEDDSRVSVNVSGRGRVRYACAARDVEYMFDLIDSVIAYNVDVERKADLYDRKVRELRSLFASGLTFDELSSVTIDVAGATVVSESDLEQSTEFVPEQGAESVPDAVPEPAGVGVAEDGRDDVAESGRGKKAKGGRR